MTAVQHGRPKHPSCQHARNKNVINSRLGFSFEVFSFRCWIFTLSLVCGRGRMFESHVASSAVYIFKTVEDGIRSRVEKTLNKSTRKETRLFSLPNITTVIKQKSLLIWCGFRCSSWERICCAKRSLSEFNLCCLLHAPLK